MACGLDDYAQLHRQSIAGDHDGGGRIATGWLDGFVRLKERLLKDGL